MHFARVTPTSETTDSKAPQEVNDIEDTKLFSALITVKYAGLKVEKDSRLVWTQSNAFFMLSGS